MELNPAMHRPAPPSKKNRLWLAYWLLLLSTLVGGCAPDTQASKPVLTLYAAASLKNCLLPIVTAFDPQAQYQIVYNFAGSGVLAQQLMAAQGADLFISANRDWMQAVVDSQTPASLTVQPILSNQLCIIAHKAANYPPIDPTEIAQLKFDHLAIGDPDYVPLGRYAKNWLQNCPSTNKGSLWEQLTAQILPTVDACAALTTVASHSQIIGIVYYSDYLQAHEQVRLLARIPPQAEQPIHYLAAALNQRTVSRQLLEFLSSAAARQVLEAHGFQSIQSH